MSLLSAESKDKSETSTPVCDIFGVLSRSIGIGA